MRVLVAGGSGTIGVPLVRALVAAGYEVVATTRTSEKSDFLRGFGATPAVVDALDAAALERIGPRGGWQELPSPASAASE